jgi:bla regulator protein blaR1
MQAVAIESFQQLSERVIWPALLHSVWIGLVAASVSALILQSAGRLSHRARHAILLGAIALVVLGPAIATALERSRPHRRAAEGSPYWVITAGRPQAEEHVMTQAPKSSPMPSGELSLPRPSPFEFAAARASDCVRFASRARPFALTMWFLGVAIIAGFLALGARTVGRLSREADRASLFLDEKVRAMAHRIGLEATPSVFVHPRLEEPFLCGVFRPAIILPARLVTSCQSNVLDAILAHELAHAWRRDQFVNLAQRVIEMLLFFNPSASG